MKFRKIDRLLQLQRRIIVDVFRKVTGFDRRGKLQRLTVVLLPVGKDVASLNHEHLEFHIVVRHAFVPVTSNR